MGMTMNPENYYSKKTTDVANTYFNKQAKVDIIATGFLAMNFTILVVTDVDTLEKVMQSYTTTAKKNTLHISQINIKNCNGCRYLKNKRNFAKLALDCTHTHTHTRLTALCPGLPG